MDGGEAGLPACPPRTRRGLKVALASSLCLNVALGCAAFWWREEAKAAYEFSQACLDLIDIAADRMLDVIEYEERVYPGLWNDLSR